MFKFYHKSGTNWDEISELELHAKLYKHVNQTTPIIRQLLNGKVFVINGDEFKILPEGSGPCLDT